MLSVLISDRQHIYGASIGNTWRVHTCSTFAVTGKTMIGAYGKHINANNLLTIFPERSRLEVILGHVIR